MPTEYAQDWAKDLLDIMDVLTEEIKLHPNLKISEESLRAMSIHLNIELLSKRNKGRSVEVFNLDFKHPAAPKDPAPPKEEPPKETLVGEPNAATLSNIKSVPEVPRNCLHCGGKPGVEYETAYKLSEQDFHESDNWRVFYHPKCKKGSTKSQVKVRR